MLTLCSLRSNRINDVGAIALAKGIEKNKTLTKLK